MFLGLLQIFYVIVRDHYFDFIFPRIRLGTVEFSFWSRIDIHVRLFSWAVWHSCRMGARNQEQTRGRIGPQLRLGNLRVGELHFCPLCTALDQASSLSRKLAYVPGPTFRFVKLLASSGSHCTK